MHNFRNAHCFFKKTNCIISNKYNAFTLIEVLIVTVILSILLLIAIPIYGKIMSNTSKKVIETNKNSIEKTIQLYIANEGIPGGGKAPPGGWKQALMPYLQGWPSHPLGTPGDYVISGTYPDYKVEFVPE